MRYIFCVNKCLRDFQGAWNNHALSTEGNMTPLQLFVKRSCVSHGEEMGYSIAHNNTSHMMKLQSYKQFRQIQIHKNLTHTYPLSA